MNFIAAKFMNNRPFYGVIISTIALVFFTLAENLQGQDTESAVAPKIEKENDANEPTDKTEVRDLSETPIRKLKAHISLRAPSWNEDKQEASGYAININFSGNATPIDQVGETVKAGLIKMNPEVPGIWKWQHAKRLQFYPEAGWLPPAKYKFAIKPGLLAEDCELDAETDFNRSHNAPKLTASFTEKDYYIDPKTPELQQLITTVKFSLPVDIKEARNRFSVTSATDMEIFEPGSEAQLIVEPKNPLVFYLRSPLMKPREQEDLIVFRFHKGLKSTVGGSAAAKDLETKLTAYSRDSHFYVKSLASMLRKTDEGDPEQALIISMSIPTWTDKIANTVEAWKLPPEKQKKSGQLIPWTKDTVNDEVLADAEKLQLEFVPTPNGPPMEMAMLFRVPQQPSSKVFVKLPKGTAGPGGFITLENFEKVTTLQPIPREASLMGNGGLLALDGERKISVRSRGLDNLRYTIARVQTDQINHLVSQTRGSFESPYFNSGFGFESISKYQQTVQTIAKQNDYSVNYSSFDFDPLMNKTENETGGPTQHGLFYLSVEGVRPRQAADGEAEKHSPDQDWLALKPVAQKNYGYTHNSNSSHSYPTGDRMNDGRFILVTDLGLIMKEAADGSRVVYAQSFSKRGPVEGVEVTVLAKNGKVLSKSVTNSIGKAEFASMRGLKRELTPVALVATKGDDLAFVPWAKNDRKINHSRFNIGGVQYSQKSALVGTLFTERGIYRPGESIHLGGIVRPRDWALDLAGLPVEVWVYNAKRELIDNIPLKLDEGGVFSLTIPTVESAPTGAWQIQLQRPKAELGESREGSNFLASTVVRVKEFQPDRLKIKTSFEPEASEGWHSPDKLAVSVQLDTLFGMPAANRRVAANLRLTPTTPTFDKWPGWRFGLANKRFSSKSIALTDGKTDEKGRATIPLEMESHAAPMLRAWVSLEGFEADGGRGVKTELSTLVSRQPYLIGHKANVNLNYLDDKDPVRVEVVAIDADTKPVKVDAISRVLIQTKHTSVLTRQKNGTLAYQSSSHDDTLETVDIALPAEPTTINLPLDTPGKFRYEFRNAEGQVLCSIPFFVTGKGDATKNLERSGELEITFADKKWLPGEEIEFSLTIPFTGAGLITLERDTVLTEQWFQCDTKSSVQKIKLPDNIEGGVFLNVVMARALDSPDVFLNPLASGVARVSAARGEREIAVRLDSVDRVRPGERLTIGYTSPKKGHMAIWAVDEGIHLVSNYQAPDPLRQLLPNAALEVKTYQLLDVLLPEYTMLRQALSIGGDGGAGIPQLKLGLNPFKRRRDPPAVYWSGFVPCGPDRKEVFYDVPEYFAGRLKIMAVAVTPDSIGVTEQESIVKGDFVLTATAPLFVVPGDEFTASVTVANQLEGEAATDQVKVELDQLGGVEIIEPAPVEQTIPVGQEKTLRFRCRATDQLGNGELKFSASSGIRTQSSSRTFSVRPGVARAAKVQSGWFRGGSHDVAINHEMFKKFAEREAIVSTTPLGLAHGLTAYLNEFPHGCTEQIVSRAYPWLVLKNDANFGLDHDQATKAIAATMNQLSRRQGSNGGFGYWGSNSPLGFDYLTLYVGHFLTECKSSGFEVPARLHQLTMRRIRHMADTSVSKPSTYKGNTYYWKTRWEAHMRASAIYLLTRNEEITTNYALKLQDFLEAKVPGEIWHRDSTALWLAASWRLLKKESAAKPLIDKHRAALKQELPTQWEYGSYFYNSKLTREATTLTVLCRHFPEVASKLSYEELKPLTEMIEQADFHTLSAAWSVQALKAYASLAESGGVQAGVASVDGDIVKILAEPSAEQIQVEVPQGTTRFFFDEDSPQGMGAWYQTVEKGFAKNPPEKANGKHIEILRELVDAEGNPVTQGQLGETLFAKLTIQNLTKTDLPNLAITEMLPGGFEFAPPGEVDSLRPGLATRQGTDYIDVREDRALIYLGLNANASLTLQYALRPTCAGTFVIPPPYAEDMYETKVRANGATSKLIVKPRE